MKNAVTTFSLLLTLAAPLSAEPNATPSDAPVPPPAAAPTTDKVPGPDASSTTPSLPPAGDANAEKAAASTAKLPADADSVNCAYAIPASATQIDTALVTKWTEKATAQAFTFDYSKVDAELEQLKACFTTQGWQSFQDALNKSGNLNAIKTQQLTMNASIDGNVDLKDNKGNEWKLSVPMQVVYQNTQQKLTQHLAIDVLVGRKLSGELGIMQIVATPTQPTTPAASTSTNAATPPAASTQPDAKSATPDAATTPSDNAAAPVETPNNNAETPSNGATAPATPTDDGTAKPSDTAQQPKADEATPPPAANADSDNNQKK